MTKLTVPAPIRVVFNTFPLITYDPVQTTDTALQSEILRRTYVLDPKDVTETRQFFLLVGNVIKGESVDPSNPNVDEYYLPTDPISLFILFSLCMKNSLLLPRSVNEGLEKGSPSAPSMVTVEREELPSMLVDDELVTRSTLLDKIYNERFTAADMMLAQLLDKDLYPFFESNVPQKHKLILLNRDLYSRDLLLEKASVTLSQFEKLVKEGERQLPPSDYLSLKIASYVIAILHSEQSLLKEQVTKQCPALVKLSRDVITSFLRRS